jgi:hypothetical protein
VVVAGDGYGEGSERERRNLERERERVKKGAPTHRHCRWVRFQFHMKEKERSIE